MRAAAGPCAWVSAVSGQGLGELAALTAGCLQEAAGAREARTRTGERHQAALRASIGGLERATALTEASGPADLVAEELRAAVVPLGELVGELTPEDLLDRVFARFCIGK